MTAGLSDEEFVGYTFNGPPERRPRLWFLDRHLILLRDSDGAWTVSTQESTWSGDIDIDVGTWTMIDTRNDIGVDGLTVRYEHHGTERWTAVWRLTDVTIPHVHTFGRDDDVWRLGLWPD
jgi:hypothetical protein